MPARRMKGGQDIVLRATVNGIDPIARAEVFFAVGNGGYMATHGRMPSKALWLWKTRCGP
jgi:hypothetical protein